MVVVVSAVVGQSEGEKKQNQKTEVKKGLHAFSETLQRPVMSTWQHIRMRLQKNTMGKCEGV